MDKPSVKDNAILGDDELQAGLRRLNEEWGDFCIRASAEAWGKPLLDQKTKILIALAVDVVIQAPMGPGTAFSNHVSMAKKQGVTAKELEELLFFLSIYAGFNKAGVYYGAVKQAYEGQKC